MKVLRVIKIVKESRFEVVWDELVAKSSKLILVSFRNSALQEEFKFCFSEFFASINKIFISVVRPALGYYSMF